MISQDRYCRPQLNQGVKDSLIKLVGNELLIALGLQIIISTTSKRPHTYIDTR